MATDVSVQYSGVKSYEEALSLQPMIPLKRFDIFPPAWDAQKV